MSSQLRMLLWKEWRERRVQFVACLLAMVAGTAYSVAFQSSRGISASVEIFHGIALVFGLFTSIFVAMRTSLGEMTDRTRSFTSALPISAQRQGWIRLAGGLAALVVPILLGAVVVSVCLAQGWIEQWPSSLPEGAISVSMSELGSLSALSAVALLWRVTAVVLSSVTSLYVLLSFLGTALRTEAHAGFLGAAVAILWFLGSILIQALHDSAPPEVVAWVNAIAPWGMLVSCGLGSERGLYGELWVSVRMLGPLVVQAILQLAIAAWFVRRYSRRLPGRAAGAARNALPRLRRLWSFTLPNRSVALAWLTLRQSVPMCLPGLMIACLMAIFQAIDNSNQRDGLLQWFAHGLPTSTAVAGLLWSVVVGAGIFSAEIDWRVGEFWRTRPIQFSRLFATKFFVGLLAVLLVLDVTTIVFSWAFSTEWAFPASGSRESLNWMSVKSLNWPYIACIVPFHAVMFAVAVAWTCVLRRPVLGGMAAAVSFWLMEIAIQWWDAAGRFEPFSVYHRLAYASTISGGRIDFTASGYPAVALAMEIAFLASLAVAGLALHRYDPRRQTG